MMPWLISLLSFDLVPLRDMFPPVLAMEKIDSNS